MVWHHSIKMCDLLPHEKGNQWRTNTIVKTTNFSFFYLNYLYIVATLYIDIIWHLKWLYSFGTLGSELFIVNVFVFFPLLFIIYFSCFGNVKIWVRERDSINRSAVLCLHLVAMSPSSYFITGSAVLCQFNTIQFNSRALLAWETC